MTSISQQETNVIRIDEIKNIGQRFRKDLGDIDALAESIPMCGLLHPIVINENNELICCEKRVAAACRLGWSTIPCRVLHVSNLLRGELDENTMRKDFAPSEVVEIKRAIEATKQRGRPKTDSYVQKKMERQPGRLNHLQMVTICHLPQKARPETWQRRLLV